MRGFSLIIAIFAVALLFAGWAVGDNCTGPCANTGVKFVPDIASSDPDIYPINIPCCNNYTDLASVFNDINASAGCTAAQVTIFDPDEKSCSWTGPFSCNMPLECGQAPWVSTAGSCTGWVVVGADCAAGGPLVAAGYTFLTADPDIYQFSLPVLTTALDLEDVFNDLPQGASVTHFHPDQSTCAWTGPMTCNEPNTSGGDPYTTWSFTTGLRYSVGPATPVKWIPSTF